MQRIAITSGVTKAAISSSASSHQLSRTDPQHHHHYPHNARPTTKPTLTQVSSSSSQNPTPTTEFQLILAERGLDRYYTRLVENGFEDWDTFLEITGKDLRNMRFGSEDIKRLQEELALIRRQLATK